MEQEAVPGVPARARPGAEADRREWWWAEASIWTERMVSALVNGVKGGKWFSLMDKVIRPTTLEAAWRRRLRGTKGRRGWMARALSGSLANRNGIFWNFTQS